MERIWAPWRLAYVQSASKKEPLPGELPLLEGADPTCFLCQAVADPEDDDRLVVCQDELTITVLNRFPYNNGHLLVAPRLHKARLDALTDEEQLALMQQVTRMVKLLELTISPHGFNIGLNLGEVAGAGVPGHLHWHIVPRWSGDTNFMPTVASVKVIPQALESLLELLRKKLPEVTKG